MVAIVKHRHAAVVVASTFRSRSKMRPPLAAKVEDQHTEEEKCEMCALLWLPCVSCLLTVSRKFTLEDYSLLALMMEQFIKQRGASAWTRCKLSLKIHQKTCGSRGAVVKIDENVIG